MRAPPTAALTWRRFTISSTAPTRSPATIYQVGARYTMLFTDIEKRWQSAMASYEARKKVASEPPPQPAALPDAPAEEVRQVFYAKNSPLVLDMRRVEQFIDRNNNL